MIEVVNIHYVLDDEDRKEIENQWYKFPAELHSYT